jgi:1,4-alpha-glucan branching enzyme
MVQHLNYTYKSEPALWDQDDSHAGFEWIDFHDADNSVVSFLRRSREGEVVVFVVNATPQILHGYRIGVPEGGFYREIINTDAQTYGGSNVGNMGGLPADEQPWSGRTHSLMIELPPLSTMAFKLERTPALASKEEIEESAVEP